MAFFARPNLDNIQFKQLQNSELTLSGQTQIATISGLTLATGNTNSGGVIITASGASSASNNHVLTYDHMIKKIVLKEGASGGTGVYPYNQSATTTVGGLTGGTNLYNVKVVDILQDMLVPIVYPELIAPSIPLITGFTISPTTLIYERGTGITVNLTTNFSRGSIDPQFFGASEFRSGPVISYNYIINGSQVTETGNTTNTDVYSSVPITILTGNTNNYISVSVSYSGGTQPYNSDSGTTNSTGGTMQPLPSGTTPASTITLTGIYPYFWGTATGNTAPVAGQALISGGTKEVTPSNTNVFVEFEADNEYLWLAIPTGNTKTRWTGTNSPANTEVIPGALFDSPTTVEIDSPTAGLWTNRNYDFYISNYKTTTDDGITSYSIIFSNT